MLAIFYFKESRLAQILSIKYWEYFCFACLIRQKNQFSIPILQHLAAYQKLFPQSLDILTIKMGALL